MIELTIGRAECDWRGCAPSIRHTPNLSTSLVGCGMDAQAHDRNRVRSLTCRSTSVQGDVVSCQQLVADLQSLQEDDSEYTGIKAEALGYLTNRDTWMQPR